MKAIRVEQPGGREVLQYRDVPDPQIERGQVLVALEYAGVNFYDVYQRVGLYPVAMPCTLGTEAAGRVAAVGSGVNDFREGRAGRLRRACRRACRSARQVARCRDDPHRSCAHAPGIDRALPVDINLRTQIG